MKDIFSEALTRSLSKLNIVLDANALQKCARYAELLTEANEHVNLTAITDPAAMAVKHFADSLSLLRFIDLPQGASVIDVGTGAGFPGIPLLIARPDLKMTLLDGTGKKLAFIQSACGELNLSPVLLHRRAEEAGRLPACRDRFDFAVSRAVAELRALAEYCLPLVAPGGAFIAYKSDDAEERAAAQNALSLLYGRYEAAHEFPLSDCGQRCIVVVRKISQTPPKYPRPSTQIAKKPL